MAKYLDSNGLTHLIGKIKTTFLTDVNWDSTNKKITKTKNGSTTDVWTPAAVASSGSYSDLSNKPTIPSAGTGSSYPAMDGTRSLGSNDGYARVDHVHPTDTSRAPVNHESTDTTYGKGTSSNYGHVKLSDSTTSTAAAASGGTAATPKAVADAIQAAKDYADELGDISYYGTVDVDGTTLRAADGLDTLSLVSGANVTLTPDTTEKSVTIAATDTDTKNTTGATKETAGAALYLVGVLEAGVNQASAQTYLRTTVYQQAGKLYSNSKQVVNLSDTQALTNKTYNGYTLGAACAAGVDSSISDGTSSANLPTSAAVSTFVNAMLGDVAGALVYKGTAANAAAITGASYKKGWYWIASASFTVGSANVEAGDMIIAKQDKTSTVANDLDVVQTNIETLTTSEIDTIWAAA